MLLLGASASTLSPLMKWVRVSVILAPDTLAVRSLRHATSEEG
jgi:hypothetical protein